jgi:hypothetical protein
VAHVWAELLMAQTDPPRQLRPRAQLAMIREAWACISEQRYKFSPASSHLFCRPVSFDNVIPQGVMMSATRPLTVVRARVRAARGPLHAGFATAWP